MEFDQQTKASVWWKGAISSAVKGIPQGLMLGLFGFAILTGGIYLFGATSLVGTFGSFLFGSTAAATEAIAAGSIGSFIGALNPVTFVALNTVLTLVGNFLTGGDMAVAKHQQEVDHAKNEVRIRAIEGREKQVEQVVTRHLLHDHNPTTPPQHVQQILSEGPRVRVEKPREEHAADIVADRLENAERTLH